MTFIVLAEALLLAGALVALLMKRMPSNWIAP
jgi:hypothetical protein